MLLSLQRSTLLFLVGVLLPLALFGQERGLRLDGLREGSFNESELKTGKTILIFWASWSPKCRDIVDRVNAIADQWSAPTRLITVDFQENAADIERFLEGKALAAPVYLDRSGAFAKKYGVATLPSLVLLEDGKEVYKGALPADAGRLIREKFHD